jgi:hypothetical protein
MQLFRKRKNNLIWILLYPEKSSKIACHIFFLSLQHIMSSQLKIKFIDLLFYLE